MRNARVWHRVLGLVRTVIEGIGFDEEEGVVIVQVRPRKGATRRCGRCGHRAPWFDRGEGRRRWRSLDLGTVKVFLEAEARRVNCATHGPTVMQVPWARHDAGHTRDFDATVAWLAVHTSKSAVTELMRIAWRSVGSILRRVQLDIEATVDRLGGLRRIGIDEISYKRGQKYLTVVVDHDSGRLVWAAPGRNEAALRPFFDLLGERSAALTEVSADGAPWIAKVVRERAPQAVLCIDPFHVVAWANDALDQVRRGVWNAATGRQPGAATFRRLRTRYSTGPARSIKRARFALAKRPENLTERQREQLVWIARTEPVLGRAYLLKEGLRCVFEIKGEEGVAALDRWIIWARRCRIPAFVDLQRSIVRHRAEIEATLRTGLSNALTESTNTKVRLLTRVAFGFHSHEPLVALALLALGQPRPALPFAR